MPPFDTAKRGTNAQDITYAVVDGQELKMDVYYPTTRGPWRVLIFIHGGGWSEGDKAPLAVVPPGYLGVSINYRLYPQARFPAMIEDVKCAIRYLRAHAAEYNLNPNRIGLVGHSAGGHLAALAGLAGANAGWDTGPYLEQSSQVQAVVAMSAPADLTLAFPEWVTELKASVFGAENLAASSPVSYARRDAPPFLIVHGDHDDVVPVEQAECLHAALKNAGAHAQLLVMRNAGHGLEPAGGKMRPSYNMMISQIMLFLTWTLRK